MYLSNVAAAVLILVATIVVLSAAVVTNVIGLSIEHFNSFMIDLEK